MVCGLELAEGVSHRWDRECVEALKLRLRRLDALYAAAQRALSGTGD